MRILIAEDESTSRSVLSSILSAYGDVVAVEDGDESVEAFKEAIEKAKPFDLVCMDIMMPKMDGHTALSEIRNFEKEKGIRGGKKIKAIMTTALEDQKNVIDAFYKGGAAVYLVKPIDREKLVTEMKKMSLIQ